MGEVYQPHEELIQRSEEQEQEKRDKAQADYLRGVEVAKQEYERIESLKKEFANTIELINNGQWLPNKDFTATKLLNEGHNVLMKYSKYVEIDPNSGEAVKESKHGVKISDEVILGKEEFFQLVSDEQAQSIIKMQHLPIKNDELLGIMHSHQVRDPGGYMQPRAVTQPYREDIEYKLKTSIQFERKHRHPGVLGYPRKK